MLPKWKIENFKFMSRNCDACKQQGCYEIYKYIQYLEGKEVKNKMKVELFADPACWEFKNKHPEDFESFGCGPGGIGDFLVPDTVYGLSVTPCCRIHDWYYRFHPGRTEADREMADRIFKNNMIRLVMAETKSKFLRWLRLRRVNTMFFMVRFAGGVAFFGERNKKDEVQAV